MEVTRVEPSSFQQVVLRQNRLLSLLGYLWHYNINCETFPESQCLISTSADHRLPVGAQSNVEDPLIVARKVSHPGEGGGVGTIGGTRSPDGEMVVGVAVGREELMVM